MNKEIKKEYRAGFDCGINGANEENCNFRLFATPEQIEEWRRGMLIKLVVTRKELQKIMDTAEELVNKLRDGK